MPIPAGTTPSSKPKVLVPEKVSPDGLALLQQTLDVHEKKGLSPQELLDIIPEYEALIVRSETKVTAELLQAARKLKVVARAGVGVDNVDVSKATEKGIIVVNSPSGNINAAAEHTIALMMAVARNLGAASVSIKGGKWERSKFVGVEVKGKTLAIVGLGKVGLTVARIAQGMGMHLIAFDPYANLSLAAAANVTMKSSLAELLPAADFLTLHTPLIASTKGMISASELAAMKPTARILNVARGGMIDEQALLDALEAGKLGGAGMDVFTGEPPSDDSAASRLIKHDKVVATPHLGASTVEAQENVSVDVCEQVISILAGELPRSAVNAPLILPDEYRTLQPFVALVESMGSIYTQHYTSRHHHRTASSGGLAAPPNFRTTFDITYEGSLAELNTTKPLFAALVKGLLAPITSPGGISVNIVNAELVAKQRGILINELRSREAEGPRGPNASIILKGRKSRSASQSVPATPVEERKTILGGGRQEDEDEEQVIEGFVSANTPFVSRIGRFTTSFVPQGTLLICRHFDSCGRIGFVGSMLGKANVNIRNMSVSPVDEAGAASTQNGAGQNEALMILTVDKPVSDDVVKGLVAEEGVLETSVVTLG